MFGKEAFEVDELFELSQGQSSKKNEEFTRRIGEIIETLRVLRESGSDDFPWMDAPYYIALGGDDSRFLEFAALAGKYGDSGMATAFPKSLPRLQELKLKHPELFVT